MSHCSNLSSSLSSLPPPQLVFDDSLSVAKQLFAIQYPGQTLIRGHWSDRTVAITDRQSSHPPPQTYPADDLYACMWQQGKGDNLIKPTVGNPAIGGEISEVKRFVKTCYTETMKRMK